MHPGGREPLTGTPFGLGLGSNRGDRFGHLVSAARALGGHGNTGLFRLSAVYAVPPREGVGGGDFLNCVMTGAWTSGPDGFAELCRDVERARGSATRKDGGARTLDVDILFFGDLEAIDGGIVLPHPRMHLRDFVLVPLREVWPDAVPGLGATPGDLLAGCPCDGHITPVTEIPLPGSYWSGTDA